MKSYMVNWYKEKNDSEYPQLHTLCSNCAITYPVPLEQIDVAGTWDECELCLIQNVPGWYREGSDYDAH